MDLCIWPVKGHIKLYVVEEVSTTDKFPKIDLFPVTDVCNLVGSFKQNIAVCFSCLVHNLTYII